MIRRLWLWLLGPRYKLPAHVRSAPLNAQRLAVGMSESHPIRTLKR